ncbi:MAG: carbohydrate porin [Chthoniobacterales bacterium]
MKNPPGFYVVLTCALLCFTAKIFAGDETLSSQEVEKSGFTKWSQGEYLSGEWFGLRPRLSDDGVDVILNYTTNIAGNPVGGMQRGFTYTDNTNFGLNLNLEKLVGWKGATFTISALNRSGTSLSEKYIGNQFTVQQIYGGQTAIFYGLYLEQKLFDDRVSIKLGRFAAGDDFGSSPVYWLYMNNGIDGNPQALPVNSAYSSFPWSTWASRLKIKPTKETYVSLGVYQATTRLTDRNYQGMDWSIRSNDGVVLISQFGWSPEWFKKEVPMPQTEPVDGKSERSPKSLVAAPTEMRGLPGNYWFGAYYSPFSYKEFGNTGSQRYAYGFYWHADQMVYQEEPGSDQGLTLWGAFVYSPQQSIAKLPFQSNGGIFYKGLIPGRDKDYTIFGAAYGKFSRDFAKTVAVTKAGSPDYELVFEAAYRFQITPFAYVQPDIQWVINPGGTGNIDNALVIGAQIGITF